VNVPPIFKSLKLYQALAYVGAGVLGLLVLWGKLPPEDALAPAVILAWILGILAMFGIVPELRAGHLIK
jgi:hypothetical protein